MNQSFVLFLGRRDIAGNIKTWLEMQEKHPKMIIYDDEPINDYDKQLLINLNPAYIFCVQYHRVIPEDILEIPSKGCINVHPAYLPFNRGWNTPSWAIIEGTPYGATMHYMTKDVDAGDIIYKKRLIIEPYDTAHTLYLKVLKLEEMVFRHGFNLLMLGEAPKVPQREYTTTTTHKKSDLDEIRKIDPDDPMLRRLRALTTSRIEEAGYFDHNGEHYTVRVKIEKVEK